MILELYGPWLDYYGNVTLVDWLDQLVYLFGWFVTVMIVLACFAVPAIMLRFRAVTFSVLKSRSSDEQGNNESDKHRY